MRRPVSRSHHGCRSKELRCLELAGRFVLVLPPTGLLLRLRVMVPQGALSAMQLALESAVEEGDDFGEWADTSADDAAAVGGVPPALAPYLSAWTQLLKVLLADWTRNSASRAAHRCCPS